MRRVSIVLIVVGLVLIIAGGFFYKTEGSATDSKAVTVTKGGTRSFQWPVYTGIILLFLGGTFNVASRRNDRVVNHEVVEKGE
ncbi:hypothetical protein [Mucilaginibacter ginkgonis]|uniref:Uncharacterized protein n=1 Tax=Mucilaginibacter ginkgonis TaxID=2682091 RepID=A0A6I4I2W0_9SPHI|nr:hypothetical protein [Mucilaginibacter ginkgonis]QQL49165.1 hypothetical protein GO620_013405 [Mucilaginibacter ginkgonis]